MCSCGCVGGVCLKIEVSECSMPSMLLVPARGRGEVRMRESADAGISTGASGNAEAAGKVGVRLVVATAPIPKEALLDTRGIERGAGPRADAERLLLDVGNTLGREVGCLEEDEDDGLLIFSFDSSRVLTVSASSPAWHEKRVVSSILTCGTVALSRTARVVESLLCNLQFPSSSAFSFALACSTEARLQPT